MQLIWVIVLLVCLNGMASTVDACPKLDCVEARCHMQCIYMVKHDEEGFNRLVDTKCVFWHLVQLKQLKECKQLKKICYCKLATENGSRTKKVYPFLENKPYSYQ